MTMRKLGFWGLGLALLGAIFVVYIITQDPDRIKQIDIRPATRPDVTFMLPDSYAYRQDDETWSSDTIGTTDDTLYAYGCTIASVALAASNLTQTRITPQTLNASLAEHGGFTDRGWLIWSKVHDATNGQVKAQYFSTPSHDDIDTCMADGAYPVVKIKLRGGIVHWVAIVGTSTEGYLIRDPLVGGPDDLPIQLSERSDGIFGVRCIKAANSAR